MVTTAELSSKHKLVDPIKRNSEDTRVIVITRALIHQHLIENNLVE